MLRNFLAAMTGRGSAKRHLESAAELANAGRLAESAESWRQAIALDPLHLPTEAQLAALEPVMPQVARDVLDGLMRGTGRRQWTLERRGSFDGEERWRLMQDRHDEMAALLPTLRYLALALAHTTAAPGRLRIDCDRPNDDSEAYMEILQVGEAIITWDESRRITDVRVQS